MLWSLKIKLYSLVMYIQGIMRFYALGKHSWKKIWSDVRNPTHTWCSCKEWPVEWTGTYWEYCKVNTMVNLDW